MAGNIIPAIATTNASTAGLCVLQAFKVMRKQLEKAKMVFLTAHSLTSAIIAESLGKPNPNCPTCGVTYATLNVNTKHAKLSDLVTLLKEQVKYSDEFRISQGTQLFYDPDEDLFLEKTFDELNFKGDTFLTVSDEVDEEAKVDIVFSISEQNTGEDTKPLTLTEELELPKKPKVQAGSATNGHASTTNGTIPATNGKTSPANGSIKRTANEAGLEDEITRKKGKVMESHKGSTDNAIVLDDDNNGAIIIDDD